jgi:membrane associated rhomboid family serine protease
MLSFTNILIIVSFLFTLAVTLFPELYVFGMNTIFLEEKNYLYFVLQFFFYSFIHGGILHFLSNALFLLYFGNELEKLLKDTKYIIFFLFTTLFVAF